MLVVGTLVPTRRRTGPANRPNYSGKRRRNGLHFLALTDERGRPIWISAARHDRVVAHLREAGLGAPADLGFVGLDDDPENPVVVTGYKATGKRKPTRGQKSANTVLSAARALVEHGFAHLKNRRIPAKPRTDPARATTHLPALPVLTDLEVNR